MKFIPAQISGLISGLLTVSCMLLVMPAVIIYQQAGMFETFSSVWWQSVVDIAPIMLPLGLLIGFSFNIAIRLLTKPAQ